LGRRNEGSVFAFGRVFFPNLGQFRIEVIDNNNPITTFGKYGKEDSGDPSARVKKPDIPLAWPNYVADVTDNVNRRVVGVKLGYASEATYAVAAAVVNRRTKPVEYAKR
jgi:hypothetical protein